VFWTVWFFETINGSGFRGISSAMSVRVVRPAATTESVLATLRHDAYGAPSERGRKLTR
jgi:hypothetical protein